MAPPVASSPLPAMDLPFDRRNLVIKVKHGDTLRRMGAYVNGQFMDLNMSILRAKIISLFKFNPDADFILTYTDEDGDIVTLDDDDELRDAAIGQHLNPLRINVQLRSNTTATTDARSETTSPTAAKPPKAPLNIQANIQSGVNEALKSVPEPFRNAISDLSGDVLKVATSAPAFVKLVKSFSKLGLCNVSQPFHGTTGESSGGSSGASAHLVDLNVGGEPQGSSVPTQEADATVSVGPARKQHESGNMVKGVGTAASASVHLNEDITKNKNVPPYPFDDLLASIWTTNGRLISEKEGGNAHQDGKCDATSTFEVPIQSVPILDGYGHIIDGSNTGQFPGNTTTPISKIGGSSHSDGAVNILRFDSVPSNYVPPSTYVPPIPPVNFSCPVMHPYQRSHSNHENAQRTFHKGIQCDACGMYPIVGPRFKSKVKDDYDLCNFCFSQMGNETIFITAAGAWKLGSFGFAIPVDQASGGLTSSQQFHYPEYDVEDDILPLQPSLNYTAPELVRSKSLTAGCSSDMFSFGCLAYHLIARKPLLDCHNNVKMYMNTLTYLTSEAFSMIPPELIGDLQRMLSQNEASRQSAMDFTGSSFFRDDTRLRALRFLDHMLERDNIQKTEFLKALSDMWKDFDSRVLRYKVLPPLCAELRNMVMQSMILPMVFTIAESQDKLDFELATLPALLPVLSSASGETLLLLVKHAELIINKASQKHLILHLLPVLVRAYDDTDTRIQEEVLRRTIPLARQLDSQLVKQAILPRVHGLALKTTVAAVRVNALRCLGDLVSSLDKHAVLDILQTLQRCTAVDHSAPTLMCTLGVANAIFKQYGVEFAAEHVLPLLFPLLTAQQLSVQQFAKYILFVKDILRKIEEKRGVTVTDGGIPEVKVSPALANGLHSEPIHKPSLPVSNSKSSPAWDEDWGPISRETSDTSSLHSNQQVKQPIIVSQPALSSATPMPSSTSTLNQPSRTLDDIQWPPPIASTAFTTQVTVNENQNQNQNQNSGVHPSSSFDDLDPFANWPPRPSNSASSVTGFATKSAYSYGSSGPNMSSLGFIDTSNPIGLSKPPQGSSSSNTSTGSSQSLLGMGNSNSSLGMGYSNTSSNGKRTGDLGSIFASANSGQPTPRIAPPPTTAIGRGATAMGRGINAIGRGRGRNQGNAALAQASRSEQPPILDLL